MKSKDTEDKRKMTSVAKEKELADGWQEAHSSAAADADSVSQVGFVSPGGAATFVSLLHPTCHFLS